MIRVSETDRESTTEKVSYGLGAVVGEADLLRALHRVGDHLREADGLLVDPEEGDALGSTALDRLDHVRVRVADEHRAGTHGEVEVLGAGLVEDVRPLALGEEEALCRRVAVRRAAGEELLGRGEQRLLLGPDRALHLRLHCGRGIAAADVAREHADATGSHAGRA